MIYFLFAVVALGLVVLMMGLSAKKEAKTNGTLAGSEFVGICTTALDRTVKKQGNLNKIIALFSGKPRLSNSEICKALGVSSRTAVRYMDALEKAQKVKQIGAIGQTVTYQLKQTGD